MKNFYCYILIGLCFFTACNKDEFITGDANQPPIIEIDSETGIYTIKVGHELTIAPTYSYVDNALYAWTVDGKLISSDPILKYTWEEEQELYLNLRVDTEAGYAEEELKVEVLDLMPPAINLYIPAKGLKVQSDVEYVLNPNVTNSDLPDFRMEWIRDGVVVSTDTSYTFKEAQLGIYPITIKASNEDGETTKEIEIEVVENMPYEVAFPTPYYSTQSTDRYTYPGRPVFLRPLLDYFDNPKYKWIVDGDTVSSANERVYKFTPQDAGEYNVTVEVTEEQNGISAEATVKVVCVQGAESSGYKAASASSSAYSNRVYEFLPAPGQFVNETATAGFTGGETTFEAAVEYATGRIEEKKYVSLGAFGGYIIIGFDHSIPNRGGYDFAIQGNAFDSSNEPGIVWVMQDTNGNGLPDDEWYELKGSETENGTAVQDYEVTYYKPASSRSDVYWIDNLGNSGTVDINSYHSQDYYYPLWIDTDSYTLRGTVLKPRNSQSTSTGFWTNAPYDWGYVDNCGSDMLAGDSYDGSGQLNGFKISNAIFHDGTSVDLQYIDFIKVQCGVQAKSGILGEISTEVFSFQDLNM